MQELTYSLQSGFKVGHYKERYISLVVFQSGQQVGDREMFLRPGFWLAVEQRVCLAAKGIPPGFLRRMPLVPCIGWNPVWVRPSRSGWIKIKFCDDKIVLGAVSSGVSGNIQDRASAFTVLDPGHWVMWKLNLEKNRSNRACRGLNVWQCKGIPGSCGL